ncbi:uncharacterized protein B0H18DRAFT_990407 [Fomitopsis serialis]|uniref:uncharacterized protein n=1 Tax=Fomitopsis serialis TaxID=139415 RepID=UPI002007CEF1|nr:uncharacterized protein B0H18DRAFT_990407 [Neoantrodia serialis]KAH9931227.1 hypothetical protein B0H18DRAFT_990407 [Neoantrodia serialis]
MRTTRATNAEPLPGQVPSLRQAHKGLQASTRSLPIQDTRRLRLSRRLARALGSEPAPTTSLSGSHHKESPCAWVEAVDVERSPYALNTNTRDGTRWVPDAQNNSSPAGRHRQTTHRPCARARRARWSISLERSTRAYRAHQCEHSRNAHFSGRRLQPWANSRAPHLPNCTSPSLAPSALPYFSTPQPQ